jgi:uncharacterized YccA/Bax inhibitor family protein
MIDKGDDVQVNRQKIGKVVGITICVVLALVLAWRSGSVGSDTYWIYLIVASLLGVLAGIIKNMD